MISPPLTAVRRLGALSPKRAFVTALAVALAGWSQTAFANDAKIISALPGFEFAKDSALPFAIRAYVRENKANPEALRKFAADLQSSVQTSANNDALQLACSALALVGTNEQIPFLAAQSANPAVFAAAVTALQQIATPAAVKALTAMTGPPDDLAFICTALGRMRAAGAEDFLIAQTKTESPLLRRAAFEALASIASPAAGEFFATTKPSGEDGSAAALVAFYRNTALDGKAASAGVLDGLIADHSLPPEIRIAAIRAVIDGATPGGASLLMALEGESSPAAQAVLLENFGKLEPAAQARIIAGIQNPSKPADAVRQLNLIGPAMPPSALLELVVSDDDALRIAALRAMAGAIDAPTYQTILASFLGSGPDSPLRSKWSDVLLAMPSETNAWLETALSNAKDPAGQVALIGILAERNVNSAAAMLVGLADNPNPEVQAAAAKAIAVIGAPEQAGRLFELFLAAKDPALQRDYGRALGISLTQSPDKASIIGQAKQRYATVEDARIRDTLLELLGRSGDATVLPLLFEEFQNADKARKSIVLRAISNWPDIAPLDQLAVIAKEDPERASQVFALRAYLEILQRAPLIPPDVKLERLKEAQALATRPEEHKMIISLLATVPLPAAQASMETYRSDPEVAEEYKVGNRTLGALLTGVRLNAENSDSSGGASED